MVFWRDRVVRTAWEKTLLKKGYSDGTEAERKPRSSHTDCHLLFVCVSLLTLSLCISMGEKEWELIKNMFWKYEYFDDSHIHSPVNRIYWLKKSISQIFNYIQVSKLLSGVLCSERHSCSLDHSHGLFSLAAAHEDVRHRHGMNAQSWLTPTRDSANLGSKTCQRETFLSLTTTNIRWKRK